MAPSWQTRMTANTTQCGERVPNMAAPENIVPPINNLEGHVTTMNKHYRFLGHDLFTWAVLFDATLHGSGHFDPTAPFLGTHPSSFLNVPRIE